MGFGISMLFNELSDNLIGKNSSFHKPVSTNSTPILNLHKLIVQGFLTRPKKRLNAARIFKLPTRGWLLSLRDAYKNSHIYHLYVIHEQ